MSAEEQDDPSISLDAQAEKIRSYCEIYDLKLVYIIEEAVHSGRNLDRPGIDALIKRLKAREADGVIVTGLDRLARSLGDLNTLTQEYFGENSKIGAKLVTVKYIYDNTREFKD